MKRRQHAGIFHSKHEHGETEGAILDNGRVAMSMNMSEKAHLKLQTFMDSRAGKKLNIGFEPKKPKRIDKTDYDSILGKYAGVPRLNIAIHIVGSRGDVQPFIPIAQALTKPPYSHRVRICTHPVFKDFVEENGLEFFSIGGDPTLLMAYMVKNPGLMPGMESLKSGDVGKRIDDMNEILHGCWRSCIEAGNGMDPNREKPGHRDPSKLFIADAIIANPPSYAHLQCAERLKFRCI